MIYRKLEQSIFGRTPLDDYFWFFQTTGCNNGISGLGEKCLAVARRWYFSKCIKMVSVSEVDILEIGFTKLVHCQKTFKYYQDKKIILVKTKFK